MARFEELRESRAVRLGMAEDALDYEELVRLTHVDSHGDVLTLEEEAHVVEVAQELVGVPFDANYRINFIPMSFISSAPLALIALSPLIVISGSNSPITSLKSLTKNPGKTKSQRKVNSTF